MEDELCSFYEIYRRRLGSRRTLSGSTHSVLEESPWCSHKHSPVTEERVRGSIGSAYLLKCEGDLEKCPLMPDLFYDTDD